MYERVAKVFADRINAVFESEATLEAEFKKNYETLPFDRTDHWQGIIYNIMRDAWFEGGPGVMTEPTGVDRLEILKACHPLLDYNLFSQVLLNLQTYNGMAYQSGDADKEISRIKDDWKDKKWKSDPFAPKAKMHKQADLAAPPSPTSGVSLPFAEDPRNVWGHTLSCRCDKCEKNEFNNVLSTLRALRIISQFSPLVSYRVSPKGKTPAFADSMNISMLGEGGDKYLRTLSTLAVWYLTWDSVPKMAEYVPANPPNPEGMEFRAAGIPYSFISKSGGEVLHDVLFARKLIYEIAGSVNLSQENCTMIPRMRSILIVADKYGTSLKKITERLKAQYPALNLVEGARA